MSDLVKKDPRKDQIRKHKRRLIMNWIMTVTPLLRMFIVISCQE